MAVIAVVQLNGTEPRISEFYGIVIAVYYLEHGVPYFQVALTGRRRQES